jgi:hypothetical protein
LRRRPRPKLGCGAKEGRQRKKKINMSSVFIIIDALRCKI